MGTTGTRNAKLILGIEVKGAEKTSGQIVNIAKSANTLREALAKSARTDELAALTADMAKFAAETGDTEEAVKRLNVALAKIGANEDEIRGVANAFEAQRKAASQVNAGGSSGGGGTPAAAKFRGAASLVGGGEIVGVIDDLQDLGEGFSQLATQGGKLGGTLVNALTPAMGATAAGAAVAGAAFAAAAVAIVAIGVALKTFQEGLKDSQELLDSTFEGQRKVQEAIRSGLTTNEAIERQAELQATITDETNNRTLAEQKYKEAFADSVEQLGEGATRALDLAGAFDPLKKEIDTADGIVKDATAEVNFLGQALEGGKLAANDMKAAEEELKKQRDKEAGAILARAQQAGAAVNAQNNALKATEEQNIERLASIEDEKEAIQAQIAVLQSSGSTAEAVTGEIEKLNAQLQGLGQESSFINDTALAVSRAADAEKKSIKDREEAQKKAEQESERNAERAAAAQDSYNKAVADAATTLQQAVQDINAGLQQALTDNLTDLFRDMEDLTRQLQDDLTDAQDDFNRDQIQTVIEREREIEDILRDGKKAELEAIRDGDFKALFLARQAQQEELQESQRAARREDQDRQREYDNERSDLLRNAQRERADRLVNYERQNADARLSAQRELQQAQLNRQRSLEAAANAYRAELAQLGQYLQARNQMQAQANNAALQQLRQTGISGQGIPGNGIPGAGIPGGGISGQGIPATMLQVLTR